MSHGIALSCIRTLWIRYNSTDVTRLARDAKNKVNFDFKLFFSRTLVLLRFRFNKQIIAKLGDLKICSTRKICVPRVSLSGYLNFLGWTHLLAPLKVLQIICNILRRSNTTYHILRSEFCIKFRDVSKQHLRLISFNREKVSSYSNVVPSCNLSMFYMWRASAVPKLVMINWTLNL